MTVAFLRDRATAAQIAHHLRRCDAEFVPPLAARVDLQAYAAKLAARARRFEFWAEGELAGLVACYCDDQARGIAYVSNVSVDPAWQRRGIASRLLAQCIAHARDHAFARVQLQVGAGNAGAIALYTRHGFADSIRTMELAFPRNGP